MENISFLSPSDKVIAQGVILTTGKLLSTLQGHSDSVKSVAISNDGSTVVSGSNDTDIRVWRNAIPVR